jgi:uncharacterized protein (TIGR02996 family)
MAGTRRWRIMSEEQYFHKMLNDDPADEAARLLLAEWLAERGDERAAAYRWMVLAAKHPVHDMMYATGPHTWDWWSMLTGWNSGDGDTNDRHDRLDPYLLRALDQFHRKSNWKGDCAYCEFMTRREAEEALVRALAGFDDLPALKH